MRNFLDKFAFWWNKYVKESDKAMNNFTKNKSKISILKKKKPGPKIKHGK